MDNITDIVNIIDSLIRIVGLALIFKKLNKKWWYTFIPFLNDYKLAQSVDKEEDGYVWCVSDVLSAVFLIIFDVFDVFYDSANIAEYIILLLMVIFGFINIIYSYRIYSAVIKVFNCKKLWVVLWIIVPGIVSVYWGLSSKFIPNTNDEEETGVSKNDSNIKTKSLAQGLTIDINERAAYSRFKKKIMLRDIHLSIEPGKMVLLLGGSGAGKTTFFNAVTGYEKADATILLNGVDVYKDFDKMKYDIGFVPQQELLRMTDTVIRTLEDSALLRLPKNISHKERKARIDEVMERFGLGKIKDNVISKQSGGQKKRISIAMEYISNPSLFILDEPDSGLDGILARELMSGLHDISREGKIVIVVTHTPDRVIEFFDEVIVLAKDNSRTGRLVYKGSVADAKEFFGVDSMEGIVKIINRPDEGGDGRADEFIAKYWEVHHAK